MITTQVNYLNVGPIEHDVILLMLVTVNQVELRVAPNVDVKTSLEDCRWALLEAITLG